MSDKRGPWQCPRQLGALIVLAISSQGDMTPLLIGYDQGEIKDDRPK